MKEIIDLIPKSIKKLYQQSVEKGNKKPFDTIETVENTPLKEEQTVDS